MNRSIFSLAFVSSLILITGCANHEGVAPSQNSSLQTISPSTTAVAEGGSMQRSLDAWLKEEWAPMTQSEPMTTTRTPDGKITTTAKTIEGDDKASFTLQKYVDKWKVYNENKEKMNAGKPEEISNAQKLQSMPVIGK